jgi:hypothetical protein
MSSSRSPPTLHQLRVAAVDVDDEFTQLFVGLAPLHRLFPGSFGTSEVLGGRDDFFGLPRANRVPQGEDEQDETLAVLPRDQDDHVAEAVGTVLVQLERVE